MPILIVLLILFLIIAALIGFTAGLIPLLIMLLVAGIVGWLADLIVPGKLPFGWLGAILAGLVGAWIGTALLGDLGPVLAGIPIIPALVGAIILAFVIELIAKSVGGGRRRV
jgi:uncharacterized membrane protein YeaQ/YmgE (transglycosylase-associated protein family)